MWYDGIREGRPNAPYELISKATEEAKRNLLSQQAAEAENADTKSKKKRDMEGIDSPNRWDLVMVGDFGTMLFKRDSMQWLITPGARAAEYAKVPMTLPRVANEDVEWVDWCKGGSKALSSFDYAGPFTEAVVLGTIAIRLGKKIEWDSKNLKSPNAPEAGALIRCEYRKGWELPVSDDLLRS